jgi:threonine synthase
VTDEEMIAACREMGAAAGVFAAPEGGAALVAAQKLRERGWINDEEAVVLFNTGSGLKYLEAFE